SRRRMQRLEADDAVLGAGEAGAPPEVCTRAEVADEEPARLDAHLPCRRRAGARDVEQPLAAARAQRERESPREAKLARELEVEAHGLDEVERQRHPTRARRRPDA